MRRIIRKTRIHRYTILLVVMLLTVFSVGVAANNFPVTVIDQFDRKVLIPKEPLRIVSGAPANTEILFALNLGDKIVGVTNWCDYPQEVRNIEKVGDISLLNVEKVFSLRPDLVIASNLNGEEAVIKLEELGIPVLAVNPVNFAGSLDAILLIGRATGRTGAAEKLVKKLQETMDQVKQRGRTVKTRRLKVFIVIGRELDGQPLWTAGPGSFLHEAVELAGGENIAAGIGSPWGQMSMESVLKANPDVVITEMAPEKFYTDKLWRQTAAIAKQQVYQIDVNIFSRPGPRLGIALTELVTLLEKSR